MTTTQDEKVADVAKDGKIIDKTPETKPEALKNLTYCRLHSKKPADKSGVYLKI